MSHTTLFIFQTHTPRQSNNHASNKPIRRSKEYATRRRESNDVAEHHPTTIPFFGGKILHLAELLVSSSRRPILSKSLRENETRRR
jgi:hypothetical protein